MMRSLRMASSGETLPPMKPMTMARGGWMLAAAREFCCCAGVGEAKQNAREAKADTRASCKVTR